MWIYISNAASTASLFSQDDWGWICRQKCIIPKIWDIFLYWCVGVCVCLCEVVKISGTFAQLFCPQISRSSDSTRTISFLCLIWQRFDHAALIQMATFAQSCHSHWGKWVSEVEILKNVPTLKLLYDLFLFTVPVQCHLWPGVSPSLSEKDPYTNHRLQLIFIIPVIPTCRFFSLTNCLFVLFLSVMWWLVDAIYL